MLNSKIEELGGLEAAQASDLSGMRIGWIENWATNPGALAYMQNPACSGEAPPAGCSAAGFSGYLTDGFGYDSPAATVQALLDGAVDAVWFYDSMVEDQSGVGSSDATPWVPPNGYDKFSWVHTGMSDYAANGTALFGLYGNEFLDIWDATLPEALSDPRYAELCTKYEMAGCFEGLSLSASQPASEKVYKLAVGAFYPPFDFIGEPDPEASNPALPITGWSNEVAMLVCELAGVKCQYILDDYDNCWGGNINKDQGTTLQGINNGEWVVRAPTNQGSASIAGETSDIQFGGLGIMSGWYDVCLGWTHTVRSRQHPLPPALQSYRCPDKVIKLTNNLCLFPVYGSFFARTLFALAIPSPWSILAAS